MKHFMWSYCFPVGFTLQNGICNCDPVFSTYTDKCYIDYSAIQRLPYPSKLNLRYPDLQCQFKRTSLLYSQCSHHLSMIFGSSRCIECSNLHILIIAIVIVAGVDFVILLYLLNRTVTNEIISGIIFYANIISVNDSAFLVNDNVFKPLKVFISFVNLDLGIKTCFYNGMDSYIKMWLQLFFPFYLVVIAISFISSSASNIVSPILQCSSQSCTDSLVLLLYHHSSSKWSSSDSLVYRCQCSIVWVKVYHTVHHLSCVILTVDSLQHHFAVYKILITV